MSLQVSRRLLIAITILMSIYYVGVAINRSILANDAIDAQAANQKPPPNAKQIQIAKALAITTVLAVVAIAEAFILIGENLISLICTPIKLFNHKKRSDWRNSTELLSRRDVLHLRGVPNCIQCVSPHSKVA